MRCAIYTRKSGEERAESQLGSIERQRELCEAYVASQAGEGWRALPNRFDDEGFSGGTLRRPALDALRAAIDRGEVETIVVYKIDRLTRSLSDFLELVTGFDRQGVRFVAVTQHFDTTSSTGRLMLNVLLSFAQFERELIGERLSDWFAGARARGLFCHGPAPYGYHKVDLRLVIREDQAAMVRHMYRRYPALGSCQQLADEINRLGALTIRGNPFDYSHVRRVLRSRVYLGELPHAGAYLPGKHEPIIGEAQWQRVNRDIDAAVRRRRPKLRIPPEGPLNGLLHDRCGADMVHMVFFRRGRCHRYYVPSRRRYGSGTSPDDRYRAGELEASVIAALERVGFAQPGGERPGGLSGALRRAVVRIDLAPDFARITLTSGAVIEAAAIGRIRRTARTRVRP